jgi:hypothetical protein
VAAPDYLEFLTRFPEFGEQPQALVQAAIDEAVDSNPESIWGSGTRHTRGCLHLAAHLLAVRTIQIGNQLGTPAGQSNLPGYDATLYGQEYKRMRDALPVCGFAF